MKSQGGIGDVSSIRTSSTGWLKVRPDWKQTVYIHNYLAVSRALMKD